MEDEHFNFKMQVWGGLQLEKQLQKAPVCPGARLLRSKTSAVQIRVGNIWYFKETVDI